ncbi:hypothetical protein [Nocardioides sambongensis]|uniref:hypothetical protein n=1 Tax=Nocardioides sambongensis TaxID=2589074 RepID=UPI001126ECFE|nr:hypothetical protein [Nocardioides sambongensis]
MPRFDLSDPYLGHLLRWVQDGVIARSQLIDAGAGENDIRRLLRRRDLVMVHPGVYVTHTGELTHQQREWVAVLAAHPAALCDRSALAEVLPRRGRVVQVAVERGRSVSVPRWAAVHRISHLADRIDPRSAPPRVALEHALLDVMSSQIKAGDLAGAFSDLSQVLFSRRTTVDRVVAALDGRARVSGRAVVAALLEDARTGACSVLERGYLRDVERAHGLPRGTRQHASGATGRRTVHDVRYDDYGTIVELDGAAFHGSPAARDRDARRDLAEAATHDAVTLRITYGLVFGDACRTAGWVARVLQRRGWTGRIHACPRC